MPDWTVVFQRRRDRLACDGIPNAGSLVGGFGDHATAIGLNTACHNAPSCASGCVIGWPTESALSVARGLVFRKTCSTGLAP